MSTHTLRAMVAASSNTKTRLPLLDTYAGASAAFSLSQLSSTYTGPAVRVRRSTDGAEADFTFSQIGSALISWVGSGATGTIVTWYNQTGGNNLLGTTFSTQPIIVSNNALITENGLPALAFNKAHWMTASLTIAQPYTAFCAVKRNTATGASADVVFDSSASGSTFYFRGTTEAPSNNWTLAAGSSGINSSSLANTNLNLFCVLANGASSSIHGNGTQLVTGNAGTNGISGLFVGNVRNDLGSGVYRLNGKISEIIIYSSNQSTNRLGIEANINSYYGIY